MINLRRIFCNKLSERFQVQLRIKMLKITTYSK